MNSKRRAVIAIVKCGDKILIGKKNDGAEGFLRGMWHIPGETLEGNESYEEGAVRGIMEEAGIEIEVGRYLAEATTSNGTKVKWYECRAKTFDIKAGSDLSDIKWATLEEVISLYGERAGTLWPVEIRRYFGIL